MNVRLLWARSALPLLLIASVANTASGQVNAYIGDTQQVFSQCTFQGSNFGYAWTTLTAPSGTVFKDATYLPASTATGGHNTLVTYNVAGIWIFRQYSQQGQFGTPIVNQTNNIIVGTRAHNLTTTISASPSGSGTISPNSGTYTGNQTISVRAASGYKITAFSVIQNGSTVHATSSGTSDSYTVNMDTGDATATVGFAVSQVTVNFSVSNTSSKTYDGNTQYAISPSGDSGNAVYSISFSDGHAYSNLSGSNTVTGPANAGACSYSLSVTGSRDSNAYNAGLGTGANWTISAKPVTLSFNNTSNTYNGGTFAAAVSASDPNATISITSGSLTYGPSAGSYPQITAQATGNYAGSATAVPQIARKSVTWSFGNLSNGYSGGTFNATATPSDGGAASGASYNLAYGIGVGSYPVSANANGNYTGSGSATANITTAGVSFSFSNTTATYNGMVQSASVSANPAGAAYTASLSGGPNAGDYEISADGTGNYSGHGSDTLTIGKATPAVPWSNPAAITYGTALSGSQLNATASTPGSFTYLPAIGTVLHAGAQTLTVTFTPSDTTNYRSVATVVSILVNKAPLTITANNQSRAYGVANPTFTFSYSGFVNGDSAVSLFAAPAGSTIATVTSSPGTYPITGSGAGSSDYAFTYNGGTLIVTKATPTITWATPAAITYGTALSGTELNASANVPGAFIYSPAAGGVLGAGSQALSVTFAPSDTADYNPAGGNVTLSVNKALLAVTGNNASMTYGGTVPMLSVAYSGFVNGDTSASLTTPSTASTSATSSSDVGTYPVIPSGGLAANYAFRYFSGILTITAKSETFTIGGNLHPTYDGTMKSVIVGSAPDANATFSISYAGTAGTIYGPSSAAPAAAGTYNVTVAGTGNYSGSASATLVIGKATPTLTWATPAAITYGTALSATQLNASANVLGTFAYVPASGAIPDAGTQALSVSFTPIDTTNYNVTNGSVGLNVNKAPLTATANTQSKTYGMTNPPLTIAYTGFVNGDTLSSITPPTASTSATSGSAAGIYPITLTGGTASNYSIALANGTLTIVPASLTVTASDQSRTYGAANPTLTYIITGFVNGDTATVVTGAPSLGTVATTASVAGTYAVSVSAGTLSSSNYSFGTFVPGTLTVRKAPLIVSANNQTKVYGTANPTLSVAYIGFVNGDTSTSVTPPTASTTATTSSPVGSYAIALTGGSAPNYAITLVNGALVVTKAPLTVTANNQTRLYGVANPSLTYTITGFINGDTASVTTGAAAVTTIATAASDVGRYAIAAAAGTLAATNYSFNVLIPGTLTITKAPLIATADDHTKAYGSPNPALTISYNGFLNGDTASSLTAPIASTAATSSSSVGTYAIALSGGAADNYALTLIDGTLTVTQATLTVTADSFTRVYGGQSAILTCSYSGFVNGETASAISGAPSLGTAASGSSDAGTYPIIASRGTLAAANYLFSFVNGTLTISPKPITFTFSNLAYVYDGGRKTAIVTPSDSAATYVTDTTKGPDANIYMVSATGIGNYTGSATATLVISAVPVTFTFSDLFYGYDGQPHSAAVVCSNPTATFTTDLSKGPDANTYLVTASATGNFAGSGSDHLVISPASQTIKLTPSPTATGFVGQQIAFSATGGANGYTWSGSAGATGSNSIVVVTFPSAGPYTITVSNNGSKNYTQSNAVTTTITITSNHQVNRLTPVASSFTVVDPGSPMNGQSYGRLWNDGGWTAYLGREGVKFEVQAQAYPSVKSIELQAKQPGGDWTQLALNNPTDGATNEDVTFSVMLDRCVAGQPLVPLSYSQGNPLTGAWSFRARVQDGNGDWSDFSDEVQVNAILPIVTKSISGQTVPPAGLLGDWFAASDVKAFSIPLWVP